MKQKIKNILGASNARKVGLTLKYLKVSKNRFIRRISGITENIPSLETRIFALPDAHMFFGYYDLPQFSFDDNLVLATAVPLTNQTHAPTHLMKLGYFDMRAAEPEFHTFGQTNTWCWQQGCRLQWYPFQGSSVVLYNTMVDGRYGCVLQNIFDGEIIKSFQRPIYSVSRDGHFGLSLNFARLQRLRPGYGYDLLPDETKNDTMPHSDGIWRIDMETGEEKLLFSIRDISKILKQANNTYAPHYFNHILFNISGTRFMFFQIQQLSDGARKINMLSSDIEGNDIFILNDSGHASHYTWKDDNHLLCYSTVTGKGEGYYIYKDRSDEIWQLGKNTLFEDGHPSYVPTGRQLITDTYPDKYSEQALLMYDYNDDKLIVLDREYSPVLFDGETRCDLHPRLSRSGKYICVDCILNNKRVMKLFDISPIANSRMALKNLISEEKT